MEERKKYYRRVIKIKGEDSPNVRYAMAQQKAGITPTNDIIVPGILPWSEYVKRRQMWDKVLQCVGLDAEFYEGAEVLMYPPEWLNRCETLYKLYQGRKRKAKAIGVDSGEGDAETVWVAIDELGIIELIAKKTVDTSVIVGDTIAFGKRHNVPATMWGFDRGGGGKQHADNLRRMGYDVVTVGFGESVTIPPRVGMVPMEDKQDVREERYVYKNRRAQMYGLLRLRMRPEEGRVKGFAFNDPEFRRQIAQIPLQYDGEGRMYIPPKNKRQANSNELTLTEIIGCSPDRADAVAIAVWLMDGMYDIPVAGAY